MPGKRAQAVGIPGIQCQGRKWGKGDPEGGGGAGPLHRCPSIAVTDTMEGADPEGGGWGEVG